MQQNKKNVIVEKSFDFSLQIIEYCDKLNEIKKYQLSKQLFGSGTSIGANVREAQNAESIGDFIHKMKVAAKECDETEYWLGLAQRSKSYPDSDNLIVNVADLNKILSKIISTSKAKRIVKLSSVILLVITVFHWMF